MTRPRRHDPAPTHTDPAGTPDLAALLVELLAANGVPAQRLSGRDLSVVYGGHAFTVLTEIHGPVPDKPGIST